MTRTAARPAGRPSKFSDSIAKEIADRISAGEPLAQICRSAHMPHPSTVRDWQHADAEFSRLIARAREIGHDAIASDCLNIADDRSDDPASRRVRVETRLKLLAKWDPKRYGDKIALTGGAADDAPIKTATAITLSPEDLARTVEALKDAF